MVRALIRLLLDRLWATVHSSVALLADRSGYGKRARFQQPCACDIDAAVETGMVEGRDRIPVEGDELLVSTMRKRRDLENLFCKSRSREAFMKKLSMHCCPVQASQQGIALPTIKY